MALHNAQHVAQLKARNTPVHNRAQRQQHGQIQSLCLFADLIDKRFKQQRIAVVLRIQANAAEPAFPISLQIMLSIGGTIGSLKRPETGEWNEACRMLLYGTLRLSVAVFPMDEQAPR